MATLSENLRWATKALESVGIEDASRSAEILLSFATKKTREDLAREPEFSVDGSIEQHYRDLVAQRAGHVPVAYITNNKEFFSLDFLVNKDVLIPRPETELLVEWCREKIGDRYVKVCDVGTGSGVIAVTLKKIRPQISMTAIDRSMGALMVAKQNAAHHKTKIEFVNSDLFSNVFETFDVVVANLPYVSPTEMQTLSDTVLFEPWTALEGQGADGLDIYRQLLDQIPGYLSQAGEIFLEFGKDQKEKLISLLKEHSFITIETRKDYAGIDRVIYAKK